jgi:hypothetical protein
VHFVVDLDAVVLQVWHGFVREHSRTMGRGTLSARRWMLDVGC